MTDFERYEALCARIRDHCAQHGSDGEDGVAFWPVTESEPLDRQGVRPWSAHQDTNSPFIYPPATEEQLQATEAALGLPLPPLLRTIYAEVANGGFGPGYGITGAKGGFSVNGDGRYDTIDRCTDTDPMCRYVDLAALDTGPEEEPFALDLPFSPWEDHSYNQWPAHFLHLAYGGCGCDFWLDAQTGRIYYGGPNLIPMPNEFEQRSADDSEITSLPWTVQLTRIAPSLEVWLEAWLRGDQEGVYGPVELAQGGNIPY